MIEDLRMLQQVVDLAVGKPKYTYQMNRNAPRPEGDYAAVRLEKTMSPGIDTSETIQQGNQLIFRTRGIRILELDILFSRDDVEVDVFNTCFNRPDIKELLAKNGYALMNKYPIEIKDRTFETDWEIRNGITVIMSVVRVHETDITPINVVSVEGDYHVEDKTIHVGEIIIGDK